MKRLTKKLPIDPHSDREVRGINYLDIDEACNKLYELENFEEELGIDLITLFKALKYGVYYFTSKNQLMHDYVWLFNNHIRVCGHDRLSYSFLTCFQKQILSFEDYKKTWSIYSENLEDETIL